MKPAREDSSMTRSMDGSDIHLSPPKRGSMMKSMGIRDISIEEDEVKPVREESSSTSMDGSDIQPSSPARGSMLKSTGTRDLSRDSPPPEEHKCRSPTVEEVEGRSEYSLVWFP